MTTTMNKSCHRRQSSQLVSQWNNLFPATVTESYNKSLKFMKSLTTVAVSAICYMKKIFPDTDYKTNDFVDLKLSILKEQCENDEAQFISTAVLEALEAFDKRYLDKLALCFYEDGYRKDDLVECYMFEYDYNPAGVHMNIHTSNSNTWATTELTTENARLQTVFMLNNCLNAVSKTFRYPPPSYEIIVKLYYNDDAPEGYQAPGFLSDPSLDDHLETLNEHVGFGNVATPYHKMEASGYSRRRPKDTQFQQSSSSWPSASQNALPSQNSPVMPSTITQEIDFNDAETVVLKQDNIVIRCPCNKKDTLGLPLITCMRCNSRQHAVCFGVQSKLADMWEDHCCIDCYDQDHTLETDPRLAKLNLAQRGSLCVLRRTLEWCTGVSEIDRTSLIHKFDMSPTNADKMIKTLTSFGVLVRDDNMHALKKVNHSKLKETINKYFYTKDESGNDLANRLLSETFGSQESIQTDPVKEVLTSMERVDLQKTTQLGRVIRKPVPVDSQVKDTTMKQYKEAISHVQDNAAEDLPLSGSHNPVEVNKKITRTGAKALNKRKIQDDTQDTRELNLRSSAKKKKTNK